MSWTTFNLPAEAKERLRALYRMKLGQAEADLLATKDKLLSGGPAASRKHIVQITKISNRVSDLRQKLLGPRE